MWGELLGAAADAALTAGRIKLLRNEFIPRILVMIEETGSITISGVGRRFAISQKDARIVLYGACQQRLIYEAVNGKFYPGAGPDRAIDTYLTSIRPISHTEEQSHFYAIEAEARRKRRTGTVVLTILAVGIGAVILMLSQKPEAPHATAYETPPAASNSFQPTQLDNILNGTTSTPTNVVDTPTPQAASQARTAHSHKVHKGTEKHHRTH